jgi:hypothetical protein
MDDTGRLGFLEMLLASDDFGNVQDADRMAYALHRDLDWTKSALAQLVDAGWLTETPGGYYWHTWLEYQESAEARRKRMQRERDKRDGRDKCHTGHEERDKEREKDKELDKEKEVKKKTTTKTAATATSSPASKVKATKPRKVTAREEMIVTIFEHWKKVWEHPRAKLTPPRRKIITEALDLGYTEADICKSIVGWLSDKWEERHKIPQRHDLELLLRIKNGNNLETGMAMFDNNARDASKLLPLEMAVRHCKTYDQLLCSKLLYRAVDITPEEASAMWTALRYQGGPEQPLWTRWAYAVLCEWCPGGDAEKLAAMGRGWVAWEEAPAADGSRLSDVDREWIINLGVVEGEG